jgi:hypothetical protein
LSITDVGSIVENQEMRKASLHTISRGKMKYKLIKYERTHLIFEENNPEAAPAHLNPVFTKDKGTTPAKLIAVLKSFRDLEDF